MIWYVNTLAGGPSDFIARVVSTDDSVGNNMTDFFTWLKDKRKIERKKNREKRVACVKS